MGLELNLNDDKGRGRAHWVPVRQGCDHVFETALRDLNVYDASFSTHNLRSCIIFLVLKT